MSPKLQRLRAEISSDLRTFRARAEELAALPVLVDAERGALAEAAVALHHAYGAIESALSRVARAVDDGLPEGPDWHQALLQVMALEVERVRPAVISQDTYRLLQRLLGFRHFFRHAYAVELDGGRLESLRRDVAREKPRDPHRTLSPASPGFAGAREQLAFFTSPRAAGRGRRAKRGG